LQPQKDFNRKLLQRKVCGYGRLSILEHTAVVCFSFLLFTPDGYYW